MKKIIKIIFFAWVFYVVSVFADDLTLMTQLRSGGHTCNTVPSTTDANWCRCYDDFLISLCQSERGSGVECDPVALRAIVQQYGGPAVLCHLIPSLTISPGECVRTLSYYLKAC